jgi:hypothetical protein
VLDKRQFFFQVFEENRMTPIA